MQGFVWLQQIVGHGIIVLPFIICDLVSSLLGRGYAGYGERTGGWAVIVAYRIDADGDRSTASAEGNHRSCRVQSGAPARRLYAFQCRIYPRTSPASSDANTMSRSPSVPEDRRVAPTDGDYR